MNHQHKRNSLRNRVFAIPYAIVSPTEGPDVIVRIAGRRVSRKAEKVCNVRTMKKIRLCSIHKCLTPSYSTLSLPVFNHLVVCHGLFLNFFDAGLLLIFSG